MMCRHMVTSARATWHTMCTSAHVWAHIFKISGISIFFKISLTQLTLTPYIHDFCLSFCQVGLSFLFILL